MFDITSHGAEKTKFLATDVRIDGLEAVDGEEVRDAIRTVLYDKKSVYFHGGDKGDVVNEFISGAD